MQPWIDAVMQEKTQLLAELRKPQGYLHQVELAGAKLAEILKSGHKILLAGNGGSAADAQHFAGEMVGRFTMERASLPAISLCTDPSVVTCIANDYGYESVFSRQVEGLGSAGDILVAISTSGNSENLRTAIEAAHAKGMAVISFLGKGGGKLKDISDIALVVPSDSTPRIQEVHTFTVHLLCEWIERALFGEKENAHA